MVTGAASGLGRAFVEELLQEGARVVAADVNEDGLAALARDLREPERLVIRRADVSVVEDVEALADEADSRFGGTDVIINNAGLGSGGPVGEVPLDHWRRVMGVNYWGVVHGCHAFVPRMKRAGQGWVLNVASMAGLVSMPEMAVYNSGKAAVVSLSETLRGELAETGVGVSVLCPAFFKTNIVEGMPMYGSNAQKQRKLANTLMEQSQLDARAVARFAIEQSRKGEFYLLPHKEGRALWNLKRIAPENYIAAVKFLRKLTGR